MEVVIILSAFFGPVLLFGGVSAVVFARERPARRRWKLIYRIERLERELFPEWFRHSEGVPARPKYHELVRDLPPEPYDDYFGE